MAQGQGQEVNWRIWDWLTGLVAAVFIAWAVISWCRWNANLTVDDASSNWGDE